MLSKNRAVVCAVFRPGKVRKRAVALKWFASILPGRAAPPARGFPYGAVASREFEPTSSVKPQGDSGVIVKMLRAAPHPSP